MKSLVRIMALGLVAAVTSPLVLAYGSTQVSPAAGCHEPSQKAPAPVSYECCRAGHRFAALREVVNLRSAFVLLARVVEFGVRSSSELVYRTSLTPVALGSPGVKALRI
ncbi:MAG: hypothetical protein ACRD3L_05340 [Terriglobales bacterium]